MEYPLYLSLGPLAIHPHWPLELLAYLVGARVYAHLKARDGDALVPEDRWWVVAGAFVGAAIGSKVLVWLAHPSLTELYWLEPLALLDGKTVVGALVGALLAVEITKKRIGIRRATGDVFAIPLVLGIAIGRVGCFLTGLEDHTHGLPASLPWAVDFGDGIPRHPAQLYEIAFLLVILLPLLWWVRRRPHIEGDLFKMFMVGYLTFRLWLEFLKPGEPIGGLNAIQWACLATLIWYARSVPARILARRTVFARG